MRTSSEPRSFTFVRDPWSHFVSGYREATLRIYNHCCKHGELEKDMLQEVVCEPGCSALRDNSTEAARDALIEIFDGLAVGEIKRRRAFWRSATKHYSAQSGIFCLYRPRYVGHLETFEEDWDGMRGWNGFPDDFPPRYTKIVSVYPDNTFVSRHASSTDPLGKGAGLLALVAAEPHWKDAVITLLRTDYDCFFPELLPMNSSSIIGARPRSEG